MDTTNVHPANSTDSLLWTMRLGGLLMILLSAFLLAKNIGYGIADDVFCAFSLGLGVFTVGASWLPSR